MFSNVPSKRIAEFCQRIILAGMEIELSGILGHKADLRTAEDLSRYFRQEVINSAEVVHIRKDDLI
jgi:predicted nucleotidyltransferase